MENTKYAIAGGKIVCWSSEMKSTNANTHMHGHMHDKRRVLLTDYLDFSLEFFHIAFFAQSFLFIT